jgi:acetyl esterase/lipase
VKSARGHERIVRHAPVLLTVLAGVVSVGVLGLVIGAFLDPTGSRYAVVASSVWAPFGPFVFLASTFACIAAVSAWVKGRVRLGGFVMATSITAMIGAGYIVARIGLAASAAGGAVDLPAALMIGDMDKPAPDVVEIFRTVDGQDLRAAIYLPPPSPDPSPVILYIHGGGFMTGTFTETAADLRWFADRGWLVVSVEYRLFGPGNPTWDKAPDDATCALAWTHRHATRFGGDPARIALLGDSAGGNLAMNLGFASANGRATSDCGSMVPMPAALAVLYPAVDPVSIYENGFPIAGFEPEMLIEGYIGGPPDLHPERMAAISSATHLTPKAPPTLIILPEKDSLVVAEGTRRFADDARGALIPLELVQIPFANHVFNQVAANSLGNQVGRTVRLRFLEQHVR